MAVKTAEYRGARYVYLMEAEPFDPENRNRLVQSVNLSATAWAKVASVVVSASARTDPDGGTDAWKVAKPGASATEQLYQNFDRPGTDPGHVAVITAQADTTAAVNRKLKVELGETLGATYAPTAAVIAYGPGVLTVSGTGVLIDQLSTTQWTQVQILWTGLSFVTNMRLRLFPGDALVNTGTVHLFLPHIEDELPADGLGSWSRGPRRTTTLSGPGGAAGQTVTVRAATDSFTSRPSDTYPGGSPSAPSIAFPEGLLRPSTVGVSGMRDYLIGGVAQTTLSGLELENASQVREHWLAYSFRDRPLRLFRGKRGTALSTFDKVYDGTSGPLSADLDRLTLTPHDPLEALERTLDLPQFSGFAEAIRVNPTGVTIGQEDYVAVGQNPAAWLVGDMTVEARCRMYQGPATTDTTLVSYGTASSAALADNMSWSLSVDIYTRAAAMRWEYGSGTLQSAVTASQSIPLAHFSDGLWHHIAAVRDVVANTVTFYWDGDSIGVISYTNDPAGGWNGALFVGTNPELDAAFEGDLDEMRVWSGKRTQAQIRATMNRPIEASDYLGAGLRVYQQFNEGLGGIVFDEVTKLDERRMRECYLSFDGVDDYAQTSHHADIEPSGDFTLEVRCAVTDANATDIVLQKTNAYRVFWSRTSNVIRAGIRTDAAGGTWRDLDQSYSPGRDGFVLITLRWNNTTKVLASFLNGGNKQTTTLTGESIVGGTNDLFLGATAAASNNSRVYISELRYWNAGFSDATIAERADALLTGSEAGLRLWYTFDEAKRKEEPEGVWKPGSDNTSYALNKAHDRQVAVTAKKDTATISGATYNTTSGDLQEDARFVGSGEGYQDLAGKRKPYAVGEVYHAPLLLVDSIYNVYYAALPPLETFLAVYDGGRKLTHQEIDAGDNDVWDSDMRSSPDKVFCRYNTTWNDETTDAASSTNHDGDVQVLHATVGSGALQDGLYVGFATRMTQMDLWLHTTLGKLASDTANDIRLSWQFWNGEAWEDLRGVVDGTKRLRIGGENPWSADWSATLRLRDTHTATGSLGTYWKGVANVRWHQPPTWVKESLNDIATAMSLGSPSDATDRWWIRLGVTANPTGYDKAPRLSAIWTTSVDAITDTEQGFVRLAAPPSYTPTADLRGDSTGTWVGTLQDVVAQTIDRWYADSAFSYAASWSTSGPDHIVGQYSGTEEMEGVGFLVPLLAGSRTVLYGDRAGDLALATIEAPEDASVSANVGESREDLEHLGLVESPDPISTLRLAHRPYFAKLSDRDINPLLPHSRRMDLLQQWRVAEEVDSLVDNASRYLGSEPLEVATHISRSPGTDTLDSEVATWTAMLGSRRRLRLLTIPTGLVEHTIGTVLGLKVTRHNIWHGVGSGDGPAHYVLEFRDDADTGLSTLTLWG